MCTVFPVAKQYQRNEKESNLVSRRSACQIAHALYCRVFKEELIKMLDSCYHTFI